MTIHWKAVEQYFTVVRFVNPLTPRVKPWMIQSFLTFDLFFNFCNIGKFINFGLAIVRSEMVMLHDILTHFTQRENITDNYVSECDSFY